VTAIILEILITGTDFILDFVIAIKLTQAVSTFSQQDLSNLKSLKDQHFVQKDQSQTLCKFKDHLFSINAIKALKYVGQQQISSNKHAFLKQTCAL